MSWPDQKPPAIDVLLHVNVPCTGPGAPAYLEIDKLADGRYRATVGTLFEHQTQICVLWYHRGAGASADELRYITVAMPRVT
jgi:hypothetical protein